MNKLKNLVIAITSNERWSEVWYSKHNYAFELSLNNHVFFINPPKKWRFRNLLINKIKIDIYNDNLIILSYQNFLPLINRRFNLLNNYLVSKYLLRFFRKRNISISVFWSFDPTRLYNPNLFEPEFSIFHCVDLFSFKYIGEKYLCEKSKCIIANSDLLLDNYKQFSTPQLYIPHGISSEEFEIEESFVNVDYDNFGLYFGVIDERLDYEALEHIISKFRNTSFVFIGPLNIPQKSKAAVRIFLENVYPNVFIHGAIHYKIAKYFIRKSIFCLALMDKNYPGNTIAHHKIMIYLAQGKPVFSNCFTEYAKWNNILYMSDNIDNIADRVKELIDFGEDESLIIRRIEFAKQYSYENLIGRINNFIIQL